MGDEQQKKDACSLEYDELLEFYEKHYFHEVDMREKLLARVQISLAMFVAIGSLLSYMLSNIKTFHLTEWKCIVFTGAVATCAVFLIIAFCFFIKSFFNYTYQFIPTARVTEEYRLKLIETYEPYEDREELVKKYFKQYLFNIYVQCTTLNAENNELRSAHFHNTTKFLVPAFCCALVALMFFYFAKVNKEETKDLKITVTNPIEFKEAPNVRQQPATKAADKPATATDTTTGKTDKRGR